MQKLWRITLDTNPEDCNLSCIMCEEHSRYSNFMERLYKETGVKRRRMPFAWVERIFREAAELGVREIIPSTMGEPLLYKDIDRIFSLASEYGIKINLTTNGSFPKKTSSEWARLIVPVTSDVKISWNGATKQTAESVMPGINFEKAVQNVEEFITYRNSYFCKTGVYCRVSFQLTFMRSNMHELPGIISLAAVLGVDRIKGHHLWDHFAEIKAYSFRSTDSSVREWNTIVRKAEEAREKFLLPGGKKILLENVIPLISFEQSEMPENYECPFLEKELWISATGKISPCCAPDEQRKSLGDFGNIETNSIANVMDSEIYRNLVKNYKTKPLCRTCTMRKP